MFQIKSREKKKSLLGLERLARLKRASNLSSSTTKSNSERSSKRPRYDDDEDDDEDDDGIRDEGRGEL